MQEKIKEIEKQFNEELNEVNDLKSLEEFRIKFLGRKGIITELFDEFKQLPSEEKPKYGKVINQLKNNAQNSFNDKKEELSSSDKGEEGKVDLTLPGIRRELGTKHILTQTLDEMKSIFKVLGFSVYEGPELESDYYNFEALNFPEDHPARDMQDTFFVNKDFLLRTHTSPVQIRLMKEKQPPVRAIMPGKVFRNEAISAKSYCLFHQLEGLVVDTDITFSELKGTVIHFVKEFFGHDVEYRFRPSFFPFTEPSAEVDIWWQPEDGLK